MNKIPFIMKFSLLIGFISSIFCLLVGLISLGQRFSLFLISLGFFILFINIGLIKFSKIAKIIGIIFAFLFITFYLYLTYAYIISGAHYGWGVGLFMYYPVLIWSILVVICYNVPRIKKLF